MPEKKVREIADKAKLIVNGYAFSDDMYKTWKEFGGGDFFRG